MLLFYRGTLTCPNRWEEEKGGGGGAGIPPKPMGCAGCYQNLFGKCPSADQKYT